MKKIWFFLLMLPLFCIGDTEADMINSAPVLAQNPEYSAPRTIKTVPTDPAITYETDIKTEQDSGTAAAANTASHVRQAVSGENESIGRRQVYRRKRPTGINSLSDGQGADRTVYDPSSGNARIKKTASSGMRTADNSDELARWKESQKNPTRKFIPSDIFREFSLLSSYSTGCRSSNFRTGVRKRFISSGTKRSSSLCGMKKSSGCCGKVKIYSSCSSGTCTQTTLSNCR